MLKRQVVQPPTVADSDGLLDTTFLSQIIQSAPFIDKLKINYSRKLTIAELAYHFHSISNI